MKKWITGLLILLVTFTYSQDLSPAEKFKQKNAKNYWCYMDFNVKSIQFFISSPDFIHWMDSNGFSDFHYIQKVTWKNNGEFVFELDSAIYQIPKKFIKPVLDELDTLRNAFWGLSFDLQSFLMENPLTEIPFDAEFWGGADTAVYQFTTMDRGLEIIVRRVFLITNGLLLKQIVKIGNQIIYVYPHYMDIGEKWQCVGWTTQNYKNGKLASAMEVRFDFVRVKKNFIFPEKIQMIVKIPQQPQEIFISELYLYKLKVEYE